MSISKHCNRQGPHSDGVIPAPYNARVVREDSVGNVYPAAHRQCSQQVLTESLGQPHTVLLVRVDCIGNVHSAADSCIQFTTAHSFSWHVIVTLSIVLHDAAV